MKHRFRVLLFRASANLMPDDSPQATGPSIGAAYRDAIRAAPPKFMRGYNTAFDEIYDHARKSWKPHLDSSTYTERLQECSIRIELID